MVAIALQGVFAIAITLLGRYEQILNYVVSMDFIFFGLSASCLFVFRRRERAANRKTRQVSRSGGGAQRIPRTGASDDNCSVRGRVVAGGDQYDLQISAKHPGGNGDSYGRCSRIFSVEVAPEAGDTYNYTMNPMRSEIRSPYMEFAKLRSHARFNLATSGLAGLPLSELPVRLEELQLSSPGGYGYPPLMERLAKKAGVPVNCVVAATGTSMANHLAMAAVLEPGDEVLIEHPTYELLITAAEYLGARVRRFPRRFEDGFRLDPREVAKALTPRTRLVVLTNFHNPSGVRIDDSSLREVGELARNAGRGCWWTKCIWKCFSILRCARRSIWANILW